MIAARVKSEGGSGHVRMKKKRPRIPTTGPRPDERGPRPMRFRNTTQPLALALYEHRPARIVAGEPRERTHIRELVVMLVDIVRARLMSHQPLAPIDHLALWFALRGKAARA